MVQQNVSNSLLNGQTQRSFSNTPSEHFLDTSEEIFSEKGEDVSPRDDFSNNPLSQFQCHTNYTDEKNIVLDGTAVKHERKLSHSDNVSSSSTLYPQIHGAMNRPLTSTHYSPSQCIIESQGGSDPAWLQTSRLNPHNQYSLSCNYGNSSSLLSRQNSYGMQSVVPPYLATSTRRENNSRRGMAAEGKSINKNKSSSTVRKLRMLY